MTRYRGILIAFFSWLIGCVVLFFVTATKPGFLPSIMVLMLTGTILAWQAKNVLGGQPAWFSPHAFVLIAMFLIEVAGPAMGIYYGTPVVAYGAPALPGEMFYAVLVGLVATCCYMAGWWIGPKRASFSPALESYFADTPAVMRALPAGAIGVFLISIMAWSYMYISSGGLAAQFENQGGGRREMIAGTGGFIWHLAKFGYAGCLLFFARFGPRNIVAWVMIACLLLFLLIFGSRSFAAVLVVGVLIVYRCRFVNRISPMLWLASITLMMSMFIGLLMIRSTKGDVNEAINLVQNVGSTAEGKVSLVLGDWYSMFQARIAVMGAMGNGIPYQHGYTFLTVLDIVPDFIWETSTFTQSAARVYMIEFFPQRIGKVAVGPGFVSELYMNFGWTGVVILSLCCGLCVRWLNSRLMGTKGRSRNIAYAVALGLINISIVRFIKSGPAVLITTFYILLPVFVIYMSNIFTTQSSLQYSADER